MPDRKSDRRAHGEQHEDVDGHFRDREIDAHPSNSISIALAPSPALAGEGTGD